MVQLNLVLFWRSILIFLVSLSTSSFWLFPHPFPCLPISVPCLPLSLYPFVCSVLSLCSCVSLSHQPTVPVCQPACLVFQFPFCLTWTENCDSEPLFLKMKQLHTAHPLESMSREALRSQTDSKTIYWHPRRTQNTNHKIYMYSIWTVYTYTT